MPASILVLPAQHRAKCQVWTARRVTQRRDMCRAPAAVKWSERCRAQQDGWVWAWGSGPPFQETLQESTMDPEVNTAPPLDGGRLPQLFAALTFLVALPLLCPFRFPVKACPNWKISSTITASQGNLNSASGDSLPLHQG